MTGASKILTVSYGTFSCTLEGFDDPFNTMKAIAEYFRDLAAGDRYFGAEPPVPDAAMLHRIAEREIHRRVEAKIQDNGVILRAGDAADLPVAEAPRPALVDGETAAETVAARLQRIRARHTGQAKASSALTVESDQFESYSEDEHAEEPAPVAAISPEITPEVIEVPDQVETLLDEAETDLALAAFDTALSDALSDPPGFQPEAAFDVPEALVSLAVSADTSADIEPTTMIETGDQQTDIAADGSILARLAADLPEEMPEVTPEDLLEAEPLVSWSQMDAAEFAEDMPEVYSSVADRTEELDDLPEALAETDTGFDEDELLSRLAVQEEPSLAAHETAFVEPDTLEDDDLTLVSLDLEAGPDGEARPVTDTELPLAAAAQDIEPKDEAAPEPQNRARARVIRIRRSDAPAIVASHPQAATTVLSDEAEAALQAELAALEAEIGGVADAAPQRAAAEAATDADAYVDADMQEADEPKSFAETDWPIGAQAEAESINRLMAQAASQMEGEETLRRQSAIAHLKAAVAATQADRSIAGIKEADAQGAMEAYRGDLDRVVRPRRPTGESATPRPVAPGEAVSRPTPLVLVSAQRIDQPKASAPASEAPRQRVVMPVRPRRVSSGGQALAQERHVEAPVVSPAAAAIVMQDFDQNDAAEDDMLAPGESDNFFADATGFQDFADQLGASALPELLEAAAVYCAEVLQRPEFSRPLVMRQIARLPNQSDTAREDYLRSFGSLLRQGRIAKVKRGLFALTDRSPYLAEARKLAS